MQSKDWFKPKAFTHFIKKVSTEDKFWIKKHVSDPTKVSAHKFYPLIHKTIVTKRLKSGSDLKGDSIKKHYTYKKGLKRSNNKYREVYYPNHIDAHIYSYYAKEVLEPCYEAILKNDKVLNDSILAYRRIEVEDESRCKCNIDFANEVFNKIKYSKGEVAVIALDISKFFDSLDHKILKRMWANLFNRKDLEKDHYNIFKSLTNFSYVELDILLKEFGYKHPNQIVQKNISNFVQNGTEFRERIKSKGYIKKNPFRRTEDDDSKTKVGIPQGTPISALLANLYLLNFDRQVISTLKDCSGIYRRYSDDILIICPKSIFKSLEIYICKLITEYKLIIQDSKNQCSFFKDGKLEKGQRPVSYLGFQFDGNKKLIRSASVAKFYRKMKISVKYRAYRAFLAKQKLIKKIPVDATLFRKKLYTQYSFLGSKNKSFKKRNYLSYANFASRIMDSPDIKKQLSKSWEILHKEIAKHEKNYKLPRIKNHRLKSD